MKKMLHFVLVATLAMGVFTGCSTDQKKENATNSEGQTEEVPSINEAFDKEKMVALDGSEFKVQDNDKVYAAKELGFGIKFTDYMVDLKNQSKLDINAFPNWITLSYISDEAGSLIENTNFENMKEEDMIKVLQSYSEKNFEFVGVYRHNEKDAASKKELQTFTDSFEKIEQLISFDGSIYYIGYNVDYSGLKLKDEEKKRVDTLLGEMEVFKKGIAIFPYVDPNVALFNGNMKEFSAETLQGKKVTQDVFKDYDLTMVNIWATWCGPCVSEMPELQKLYTSLPENVNMLTVCTDGGEEPQITKEIIDSAKGEFPVLFPDAKLEKSLLGEVEAFPTTIFIDKNGMPVGPVIMGVPGDEGKVVEAYLSAIKERLAQIEE